MLATLCLNEMQWLPRLIEQHRNWPGLCGWVFVEAADEIYARCNPELVGWEGLSVDGTTEFLRSQPGVTHIKHGVSKWAYADQGKCAARNRYLEVADELKPDMVFVLDADEFYTHNHQNKINHFCYGQFGGPLTACMFRQRHVWRPESIVHQPLMQLEVTGGYWNIPHCRAWKWQAGMRYKDNHNNPRWADGFSPRSRLARFDLLPGEFPQCIHMGFASSGRAAKHRYYVERGEGREGGNVGHQRQMYVDCRSAFERWRPGEQLPHGADVIDYTGPMPECFQCQPACSSS